MKILYYYKPILIIIGLITAIFIGYFISLCVKKQHFILPSQIVGLVNPDTFKVNVNGNEFYITSALIKTARGNEPCSRAKKMSQIGYTITNNMLEKAKVIRYQIVGGKEDGRYSNARIYIDEVLLGKKLYKNHAAIRYTNSEKICLEKT